MPNVDSLDIVIQGHKGLKLKSAFAFMDRAEKEHAREAYNICFDLQNNVYSCTGYAPLQTASIAVSANVSYIGYSYVCDLLLILEGTSLKTVNPTTGAIVTTFATAFASGACLSIADWPQTSVCYISDGIKFKRLNAAGTALTDLTASSPLGAGVIIFAYQNFLWSVNPPGLTTNEFVMSTANTPETFSSTNTLRVTEDGPGINAASIGDNVIFMHKNDSIYAVFGQDPTTFVIRNLKTGRGGVSKTAIATFEKIDYFIGKDGYYRFNQRLIDPIHKDIQNLIRPLIDNPQGVINFFGQGTTVSGLSNVAIAVQFIPLYGPDYGRRYIIFSNLLGNNTVVNLKFDVDTLDWSIITPTDIGLLCYAPARVKTFTVLSDSLFIQRFCNTDKYNASTIYGVYTTQQIDAGTRLSPSRFLLLNQFPSLPLDKVYMDVDGMGCYSWDITDAFNSGMPLPNDATGYMTSFRFCRIGGSLPMIGGLALTLSPEENRANRSWFVNKQDVARVILGASPSLKPYLLWVAP